MNRSCLALAFALAALRLPAADALADAAREALAAGDGHHAQVLLDAHPELDRAPDLQLLRRRALLAQGRPGLALAGLEGDPPWPSDLAGAREQLRAECLLAQGGQVDAAIAALGRAIEFGGGQVAVDRCLMLLAEALAAQGRTELALRAAERVWIGWRPGREAWRAGLLLARIEAERDPGRARRLLTDLRYAADDPEVVVAAELQLCALLVAARPADALALARGARERSGDPRFLLLEAEAQLSLDPDAARRLLAIADGGDPAVARLRERLGQVAVATDDPIADALRRLDRGERGAAEAQLEAVAADPVARAIMVWRCDRDAAVALDLARPVAVAASAAARTADDPAAARMLLGRIEPPGADDPDRARLEARVPGLLASLVHRVASTDPEDPGLGRWRALLREPGQPPEIAGIAWCWAATAAEAGGGDAAAAWAQAAALLPGAHPWAAAAAQRAARPLLLDLPPGTVAETSDPAVTARLEQAARLLSGPAWAGAGASGESCRWLLAQALAQAGRIHAAQRCANSLRVGADERRVAMIQRFFQRLTAATHTVSTQVLP